MGPQPDPVSTSWRSTSWPLTSSYNSARSLTACWAVINPEQCEIVSGLCWLTNFIMCDQRQLCPAGADFKFYGTTELHSCTFLYTKPVNFKKTVSLVVEKDCFGGSQAWNPLTRLVEPAYKVADLVLTVFCLQRVWCIILCLIQRVISDCSWYCGSSFSTVFVLCNKSKYIWME